MRDFLLPARERATYHVPSQFLELATMPRGEFLKQAALQLGFAPSARSLRNAIETGAVPEPSRFGNQRSFSREHLDAFCRYMRERSYIGKAVAKAVAS